MNVDEAGGAAGFAKKSVTVTAEDCADVELAVG